MAIESNETLVVSKLELISQLDSARWQLGRDFREFGDDVANKLSVKGQLQRSIKNRPSAWGLGVVGLGFVAARLIFRKKPAVNDKKPSYQRPRSALSKFMTGTAIKSVFLAFEPLVTSVLKERATSARKPTTTHV